MVQQFQMQIWKPEFALQMMLVSRSTSHECLYSVDCEEKGFQDRAVSALRRSSLEWLPLNALEGLFALKLSALLARAGSVFLLAGRFGISQVIAVPGKPARGISMQEAQEAQETLRVVKEKANSYGISLLYELIGFSSHAFSTLAEANAVTEEADVPLVLDTFHLAVSQTNPEEVAKLSAEAIGLVHLSDALTKAKTPEELHDEDRVLPGEGGLPLAEILEAIFLTGYRGPVSVEVFHPRYKERDPAVIAQEAYHRAKEVLQASGWPVWTTWAFGAYQKRRKVRAWNG